MKSSGWEVCQLAKELKRNDYREESGELIIIERGGVVTIRAQSLHVFHAALSLMKNRGYRTKGVSVGAVSYAVLERSTWRSLAEKTLRKIVSFRGSYPEEISEGAKSGPIPIGAWGASVNLNKNTPPPQITFSWEK